MKKKLLIITGIVLNTILIGFAIIFGINYFKQQGGANTTYYSGSFNFPKFNFSYPLTTYNVGDNAEFKSNVHVILPIPKNAYPDGKDVMGISIAKVMKSGSKDLTTNASLYDTSIDDNFLRTNRAQNNDLQIGYGSNGKPVSSTATWDAFQCGEVWVKTEQAGQNIPQDCHSTFLEPGYYQIDVNTYYTYATRTGIYHDCHLAHCGVLIGYFVRVLPNSGPKPTPTPTPTITTTPTPTVTNTPTPTVTNTVTRTPAPTKTPTPTATPTQTIINTPTNTSSITPTSSPVQTTIQDTTIPSTTDTSTPSPTDTTIAQASQTPTTTTVPLPNTAGSAPTELLLGAGLFIIVVGAILLIR